MFAHPNPQLLESVQVEYHVSPDGTAPVFYNVVALEYGDYWLCIGYRDESSGREYVERIPVSAVRTVREFYNQDEVEEGESQVAEAI